MIYYNFSKKRYIINLKIISPKEGYIAKEVCVMWDSYFDMSGVSEIRLKTTVYLGPGAIEKIDFVVGELRKRGISQVLCVTGGRSYRLTGAWDYVEKACKKHGVGVTLYDKITPNPTTVAIDEAAALGRKDKAGAVIGIGGGSPIDASKSSAILLAYPDKTAEDLYTFKFTPDHAVPIIAINLTHGTGTEVDRFAVATIPHSNFKPAIGGECLYPLYSIDDPALMTKLSPDQTRYVSIDAVNHVVEAATTVVANPVSIALGIETVRLVAEYLPRALANPEDLKARYALLYASMIAGTGFDNGLLHYTHALEHPLSGMKPELAHGLGLAILLPAVIQECYPARAKVLADLLAPIVPGLKGDPGEASAAARGVEKWLASVGVPQKLKDVGFTEADIEPLCKLTLETPSLSGLLGCAPVPSSPERIRAIYTNSLKPMA